MASTSLIGRRPLLRGIAASAAAGLLGIASDGGAEVPGPGASGRPRPTQADWRVLRRHLDGELLRPHGGGYALAARLYDPRYDSVRPAAVVEAAHADDVSTVLAFARRFGLPVRAKSGGHSYVGASTVRDGLVISTTALQAVRYDSGSRRVGVGAGARLIDVHTALDRHGRTVPTGTCPTVGATGLTLGGGIGLESRAYGLTCDALQEAVVVTADGRRHTANADQQPDLFWALRGGGGGNLGIVTSLTFVTSPAHEMGFAFLSWPAAAAVHVLRGWQRRLPQAPHSASATLHLDAISTGVEVRIVVVSLTGDAHHEAAALEAAIGQAPSSASFTTTSHADGIKLLAGCSGSGTSQCRLPPAGTFPRESFVAGSDIIGSPLSQSAARGVVAVVARRGRSGSGGALLLDALGGRVSAVAPAETAFRWRTALASAQWYVGLPIDAGTTGIASGRRWIADGHRALRPVSAGGYVNYLEPGRPVASYYGRNVGRMRRLRARYDPEGVFDSPWSV